MSKSIFRQVSWISVQRRIKKATLYQDGFLCGHYKTQSEHSVNLNRKTQFLSFIAFPQFVSIERFSNQV